MLICRHTYDGNAMTVRDHGTLMLYGSEISLAARRWHKWAAFDVRLWELLLSVSGPFFVAFGRRRDSPASGGQVATEPVILRAGAGHSVEIDAAMREEPFDAFALLRFRRKWEWEPSGNTVEDGWLPLVVDL